MTSEVLVMNKRAVALAADSAVSLGQPFPVKVWPSANKLFALSKYRPVAVMVYGSASFSGFPWETVVKEYRARIGRQRMSSVNEYADCFVDYVSDCADRMAREGEQVQAYLLARTFFADIANHVNKALQQELWEGLTEYQGKRIAADKIQEWKRDLQGNQTLGDLGLSRGRSLVRRFSEQVERARDEAFKGLPLFKYSERDLLLLVAEWWTRSVFHNYSGIVVAGFGEDQWFPSYKSFVIEAIPGGWVKVREGEKGRITHDEPAQVAAFAQGQTAKLFMNGIAPDIQTMLAGQLREFFSRFLEEFPPQGSNLDAEARKAIAEELKGSFESAVMEYSRQKHSGPIVQILEKIPKEHLPEMAETLVTLTGFRQSLQPKAETVTGPTDVLLISKGDGLVWIERKHYFDPKLNFRFFENYFREEANGNEETER